MDLLFEDARVVDGTGAPWFRGAVGIDDGRIAAVRRGDRHDLDADETRSVDGAVLCPGFIDLHSHADLELFEDPTLEPKIRQGVTTEVVGQDGFSYGPVRGERDGREWEDYLSGLSGRLDEGGTWDTMAGYLDAVDDQRPAPNVATLVGHGAVRFSVMGWDAREPTDDELDRMATIVAEALDEGAYGFSTGLEYSPHRNAPTEEVRTLVTELAPTGRPFVAHIRNYSNTMWRALDEFIDIGAETGVPVHLSHFKLGPTKHGKAERALHLMRAARERGVDFTADLYPYVPGCTMLLALVPLWAHADGPNRLLEHLQDEDSRDRIKRDIRENEGSWDIPWENLVVANLQTEANADLLGKPLATVAADRDEDPIDVMCDLLVAEDLEMTVIADSTHREAETDIATVLTHDLVGIGTDGIFGDRPHPRVYGSYPRILGEYVRERNLMQLEEAVRKMTSLPARIMGFEGKGIVREGLDADLVVFHPDRVGSSATVDDPNQFPVGIEHVLVDGTFVVRDGDATGNRPGAALRA